MSVMAYMPYGAGGVNLDVFSAMRNLYRQNISSESCDFCILINTKIFFNSFTYRVYQIIHYLS
jgi:hypothetical protein